MPGALFKRSISRPESSAIQIFFDFLEKYLALINEFCKKVFPVSFGLDKLKDPVVKIFIFLGSKALISLTFPLLFDPIRISVIFLIFI